ncbi:hypothetical protein B0T16DRAFT_440080 [Cercophora newfieldiana]|uniref:Carbohydrate-binding module family 18 protein n=1 Tax=Cercophora newfieldiana TaxID=92897 RepID=A0AA40CJ99_9PEZI|nr:hypothetical protein B0T16DRAFT_440080 [Cercophora newfieldiana]
MLLKGLAALALAIGVQSQGPNSCVETITARSGETCASIAELAGISVTDFLRSNPSVTSCAALVGGGVYCKSGTSSVPPVSVSTDGTCGGSVTCVGSRFGRCCSTHGYCGSSADHCGEGCQLGFGECGDGNGVPPEAPTSDPATVIATSTRVISATSIVQATVVITRTVRVSVTDTLTARASTRVLTLTSVFPSTAIVTSTTVIKATSIRRRPRPTTTTKTQTPTPKPSAKPSPILPKTPNTCAKYDKIRDKDNCRSVASRNGISLNDFYKLNPGISSRPSLLGSLLCSPGLLSDLLGGLCHITCEKLWEGYYVCTSAK